ncbi:MAG TPA: hypothetical protein VL118_05155 [Luteimonas sp.]|nr:hypothetical protein [Luteimonas sp.]
MRPTCLPLAAALALALAAAVAAAPAVAAVPTLAGTAAAAPAAPAPGAIALGDFMGRLRSIEVAVGGQRGTFLLDTGGGVTFATPEFAKRIGCTPWGRITGFRLTGERLDLPRCDGVAIGLANGRVLAPATIGVLDLKPLLPPSAPTANGSLALDALDGQAFTLDLRAGTLEFETPQSLARRTAGAVEIPIRVSRHASSGQGLGVYARAKTAKGDLWLEIDSGGGAPVLLRDKIAAEAGADASVAQPQPYTLVLPGSDGAVGDAQVKLDTRAIVRDMVHSASSACRCS